MLIICALHGTFTPQKASEKLGVGRKQLGGGGVRVYEIDPSFREIELTFSFAVLMRSLHVILVLHVMVIMQVIMMVMMLVMMLFMMLKVLKLLVVVMHFFRAWGKAHGMRWTQVHLVSTKGSKLHGNHVSWIS